MFLIRKTSHFYAAHRNVPIGGKCANLHGHTYRVTLAVRAEEPAVGDVTIPFDDLDVFGDWIRDNLDHATLVGTDDRPLQAAVEMLGTKYRAIMYGETSVENVARLLYETAEDLLPGLDVAWVDVAETESSSIRYPVGGPS